MFLCRTCILKALGVCGGGQLVRCRSCKWELKVEGLEKRHLPGCRSNRKVPRYLRQVHLKGKLMVCAQHSHHVVALTLLGHFN